jgi:quinoprotein glucose dehydrogenase
LVVATCSRTEVIGPGPTGGEVTETSMAERQSGDKYYPFTQINRDNVRNLEIAWIYNTGDINQEAEFFAFEDEPVLIDGSLIVCTPLRRIIALDPATGAERWRYDPGGDVGRMYKCRGVVAWTDDQAPAEAPCKTRIMFATGDNRLIAIDSKTGTLCQGFGAQGIVQIEPTVPEIFRGELSLSSRPAVVNGVVVVGSAVADNQRVDGPSGQVLAFDARTGAPRWSFDPIPRDRTSEAARSWGSEGAGNISGANVWSTMSVDAERDLIYLPTTTARTDFYGGNHPGNNLYTTSVVALRGSTGEVVWHFQTSHHDLWDYDLPTGPILIDYPVNGQNVPALIQLTKQGLVFVLNRETGEPLVPVEERAVPQEGAVPEEWLSPTQPFPVGMPALNPQGFTPDDAWGFTPFDRGSCRDRVEQLHYGPIYTPPSLQGTILMPGGGGGANWGGGAYDRESGILIVPTARVPMIMSLVPRDAPGAQASQESVETTGPMIFPAEGTPYLTRMEPLMSSFGAPCAKPPWAGLVALDVANQRILWDVPLGTIDRLAPIPIPAALGTPGAGGPLVTASGLAFIGFTLDHRLRAFDVQTGEELWKSPALPAPANSTPITYEASGVQYVVVAAGGHSMYGTVRSDAVVAYRLRQ